MARGYVKVEPSTHRRLKVKAAEYDVDMEDLADAIIVDALDDSKYLDELVDEVFGGDEEAETAEATEEGEEESE